MIYNVLSGTLNSTIPLPVTAVQKLLQFVNICYLSHWRKFSATFIMDDSGYVDNFCSAERW